MIVGNGMMANAFAMRKNDEKHIIFASGVSNSTETSWEAFLREERLLHLSRQNNRLFQHLRHL